MPHLAISENEHENNRFLALNDEGQPVGCCEIFHDNERFNPVEYFDVVKVRDLRIVKSNGHEVNVRYYQQWDYRQQQQSPEPAVA